MCFARERDSLSGRTKFLSQIVKEYCQNRAGLLAVAQGGRLRDPGHASKQECFSQ